MLLGKLDEELDFFWVVSDDYDDSTEDLMCVFSGEMVIFQMISKRFQL